MNFEDLSKKIKQAKVASSADPGSDPNVYNTKLGQIRRAKEDLEEMFNEYRQGVRDRAVFIIVSGDKQDGFVKMSEKDFDCFALNSEELYEEIASEVSPLVYEGREATNYMVDITMAHFHQIALNIGLTGYGDINFTPKYKKVMTDKASYISLLREIFQDNIGGELVGLYSAHKITEKAIETDFSGKIVPIILSAKDQDNAVTLHNHLKRMFKNTFVVTVGEGTERLKNISIETLDKTTKTNVEATLLKIRNNLN